MIFRDGRSLPMKHAILRGNFCHGIDLLPGIFSTFCFLTLWIDHQDIRLVEVRQIYTTNLALLTLSVDQQSIQFCNGCQCHIITLLTLHLFCQTWTSDSNTGAKVPRYRYKTEFIEKKNQRKSYKVWRFGLSLKKKLGVLLDSWYRNAHNLFIIPVIKTYLYNGGKESAYS